MSENKNTNLFDLMIKNSHKEINDYLSSVSTGQFVSDINELLKRNISKKVIEKTIEKLKQLID